MKRLLILCLTGWSVSASAGQIEVLHYWTSRSEMAALGVMKSELARKGQIWKDFVIYGGGGDGAYSVLQTRVIAGNPPVAALMEGPIIQEWASLGLLDTPYSPALEKQWDAVLPDIVRQSVKYKGRYVALPTDIHRINWMWINPAPFSALNLAEPKNWDDFFKIAPRLKAAGYIPLALGGQDWQEATLFENLLLGLSDGVFYRKVFIEQNREAIKSSKMIQILERFRQLRPYVTPNAGGRSWPQALADLREGKAAMFMMGDWAKGELMQQGIVPGPKLHCLPAPGTHNYFIYGLDSFALFHPPEGAMGSKTQNIFAEVLMDPAVQAALAKKKGAIPPRRDAPKAGFDQCALASLDALQKTEANQHLLPSMAHSMAGNQQVRDVFFKVINYFFNHPEQSAQDAVKRLDSALQALQA